MRKIFLSLILIISISVANSFETKKNKSYDLSAFNSTEDNKRVCSDKGVKCRIVCDRKINKQELLNSAIDFYKKSKIYHFDSNSYK